LPLRRQEAGTATAKHQPANLMPNTVSSFAKTKVYKLLNKLRGSRTVIVGMGNILKGDDAAGPLLCQELQRIGIGAELIDAGTTPENYIQPIIKKAPQNLLIIDAMDFGAAPGTIRLLAPERLSSFAYSTHILSPRIFADMVCRYVKADVYFIGIQPAQVQLTSPVSEQVKQAIRQLVGLIASTFPSAK